MMSVLHSALAHGDFLLPGPKEQREGIFSLEGQSQLIAAWVGPPSASVPKLMLWR